jgi:hypothetical protein
MVLLQILKYFFTGLGIVFFADIIYNNLTQPTPVPQKNWCQNKPSGVLMEAYHSKVYYDEPEPYFYQETCYKKGLKDAINFAEDTFSWVIRVNCAFDTTCFHHVQKILVK